MTTSLQDGTMVDKIAQFDLAQELDDAERKKPWPAGIHSKTLFKKQDLRIVLTSMQIGAHMHEHHADGTLSMQVLKGGLIVTVNGKGHDLPAGTLFALAHSIRHDVLATDDSAFLLTISWPSDEELAAMKHRGYGS
jgi:quercetin dioxygenase-like cupin family protein